jgi:calcineurin-like phosphoesterase family protein
VKTTRYFQEQVLRKHPYLDLDRVATVLVTPLRRTVQPDGRIHLWGRITDSRDGRERVLRVVTLDDGETVRNAFFDRDFKEDLP